MKSMMRSIVAFIAFSLIVISGLIGCSNRLDEPISTYMFLSNTPKQPQQSSLVASGYLIASTTPTIEPQTTNEYSISHVIGSYTFNTLDELKKFLKNNHSDKLTIGLNHLYSLVPIDNSIIIEKYAVSPESNTLSVYAYRKSDNSKKIKFTWYYSDISNKSVKEEIENNGIYNNKKEKIGTQEYVYSVKDNKTIDKDDSGENKQPSVVVYWTQNNEYFMLYFQNTEYSKGLISDINEFVKDITID